MSDSSFSQSAQNALLLSFSAARRLQHSYIGSEHLLLGIFGQREGAGSRVLAEAGLTERQLFDAAAAENGAGRGCAGTSMVLTACAMRIIEGAGAQAGAAGSAQVESEHLLMSLLLEKDCGAQRVLHRLGVSRETLYARLLAHPRGGAQPAQPAQKSRRGEPKLLMQFGTDLTLLARQGAFDPVVGRERELARTVAVLCRRQKSNPVLLGDAGVGKTAIAEALAQKMAAGDVPQPLAHKRLISLELSGVIAGTKYRGEFEERVRNLLEEVRQSGDIILFIDEIHMLTGTGAAEGAIDAANLLKPALSRPGLRIVGATTAAEYKKTVRRDSALSRRFQPIEVCEPTEQQALCIVRALAGRYEAHHGLRISDDALCEAVRLSSRALPDRRLPDKAIDLIDEAAAAARMQGSAVMEPKHVKAALFNMTGSAQKAAQGMYGEGLSQLETRLLQRIAGQDAAVRAVAAAVQRGKLLGTGGRPIASFLLCGPSGVGKTELARALCDELYGDSRSLIRFDMSEFREAHSVSRLLGAPPGYVGFGEGGRLTERVRRTPHSVVLFDEAEKAHPDVLNVLLQLLDDGYVTDSEGERADFQNAVVILTSNVGLRALGERAAGFGSEQAHPGRERVLGEVRRVFRPELLNRLDDILVFEPLAAPALRVIAQRMLTQSALRLSEKSAVLRWDEHALDALCARCRDGAMGARPLRRMIAREAEEKACRLLLQRGQDGALSMLLTARDGVLSLECDRCPQAAGSS